MSQQKVPLCSGTVSSDALGPGTTGRGSIAPVNTGPESAAGKAIRPLVTAMSTRTTTHMAVIMAPLTAVITVTTTGCAPMPTSAT